jgi:hypothetical protein
MKSIQLLLSALPFTGTFGFSAQPLSAQALSQGLPSATILDRSDTGKDEVQAQLIQMQHRRDGNLGE